MRGFTYFQTFKTPCNNMGATLANELQKDFYLRGEKKSSFSSELMRDRLCISIELTFRNSFQLCGKRQEARKWRFLSGIINLCTRLTDSGGGVEGIMHFTNIYHTPKTWSGRLYGQKRHLQQNLKLSLVRDLPFCALSSCPQDTAPTDAGLPL